MGVDQNEAKRRRAVDKPKYSTRHPIAAIEKRVIDSEAFADCRPSSIVVLLLLAQNLDLGKNGHTIVSEDDAARHGVEKKTFYRALRELRTHGFIFATSRGGHGRCGTYGLTWLPLSKDTSGLYVSNFKPCAWRDWIPAPKKKRGGKMSLSRGQKSPQVVNLRGREPPSLGDKNPPLELNTNTEWQKEWIPDYLSHLGRRGLAGHECFQIPSSVVLQPLTPATRQYPSATLSTPEAMQRCANAGSKQ